MSSLTYKATVLAMRLVGIKKSFSCEETELLALIQKNFRPTDLPKKLYRKLNVTKEKFGGRLLFRLAPKSGADNTVILFLHGGGGMMGPTPFHFSAVEKLVKLCGAALYFPFYPLAPEYTCLDSHEWLVGLYSELISRHPDSDIFLVGDSAGPILSAGICESADRTPNGIVMLSPAAGCTGEDSVLESMDKLDPMLSMQQIHVIRKHWARVIEKNDPRFDIAQVDFSGFPPIQLFYGTNELFYPYIPQLIEHIKSGGVALEVHEGKGLCHDWEIISFTPEAKRAQKQIATFIAEHKERRQ